MEKKRIKLMVLLVFLSSLLLSFATRIPTRTRYLYSWDSAQFALAMDDFDVTKHQPHPPGYFLFVWIGKLLSTVTNEPNSAMIAWNVLACSLAATVLFWFAYELAPQNQVKRGVVAWCLFMFNVLTWFYSDVAEIYISELFMTALVAYICWRIAHEEQSLLYLLAGILALAAAFKLTAMLFMLPLSIYTSLSARRSLQFKAAVLFLCCLSALYLPMILQHSPPEYFRSVVETFVTASRRTSPFALGLSILLKNLRDVLYASWIAMGAMTALFVVGLSLRGGLKTPSSKSLRFYALWCLPYLGFFVFVHMGHIGYIVPLVAPYVLFASNQFTRYSHGRVLIVVVTFCVLINAAHFLLVESYTPAQIGEGLTFKDKTWKQRLAAQLNLFAYTTRSTLRSADEMMDWLQSEVRSNCPASLNPIIVSTDYGPLNWRKMQFYFPEATAVRLHYAGRNPFMIAENRTFRVTEAKRLELPRRCLSYWILPLGESELRNELKNQGSGTIKGLYEVVKTDRCATLQLPSAAELSIGCRGS